MKTPSSAYRETIVSVSCAFSAAAYADSTVRMALVSVVSAEAGRDAASAAPAANTVKVMFFMGDSFVVGGSDCLVENVAIFQI